MKNIAIIVHSLYGGGAERSVGALSKYLCNRYNVYVFVEEGNNIFYDYGGTLITLSKEEKKSSLRKLKEYKEKLHIDCAISFMEHSNFLNILSRVNETVIVSVRNTISARYAIRGDSMYIKKIYDCADGIVAVSNGVKYDLTVNYGISKEFCDVIYNFVDRNSMEEKIKQDCAQDILEFIGCSKVLLHVGRLHQIKNHTKLLVQFAKLAKKEDVKLLLVGSGPEEEKIKQLIYKLNIADKIKIITYTKNPFIYYGLASMLVLTSKAEGLPNVLLEAMMLKTAVVAVDCMSGPRELIKEEIDYSRKIEGYEICKNGILVENSITDDTGETDYLCQAMERCLSDEKLRKRLVENAFKFMNFYSNEKILDQWIAIIENTKGRNVKPNSVMMSALSNKSEVIVYGAGRCGKEVMLRILEEKKQWDFICFAVTDKSECASEIWGIPVCELTELYAHRDKALVVISIGRTFGEADLERIEKQGFQYVWSDVCLVLEPNV